MAKYLVIWEINSAQTAANSAEFGKIMAGAGDFVQQNIDKGLITSWGAYLTGNKGYGVWECSPTDLYKEIQKFTPYFTCEVNEVISLGELPQT